MKKAFTILAFLLCASLSAESFRGFLLTKDDYRLTGYVNQISFVVTGLQIEFTNDFGDRYYIYPNLVKGFGFTKDGTTYRYVSRYHQGRWYFLETVESGKRMDFYTLPDRNQNWVDDGILSLLNEPIPQYWIQIKGQKLYGVTRAGFRKAMREYLSVTAPELAKKIGSKGYRYRDIGSIVEQYNELKRKTLKRL